MKAGGKVSNKATKKVYTFDTEDRAEVDGTSCCGVDEIHDLVKNPVGNILAGVYHSDNFMCDREGFLFDEPCGMYMFSDIDAFPAGNKCPENYGKPTASFIRRHKLGTITKSKNFRNPNTGNTLTVWLWIVDWAALEKFYRDRVEVI